MLNRFQKEVENQGFVIEDLSFGVPAIDAQTQKSIDDLIRAGQDNKTFTYTTSIDTPMYKAFTSPRGKEVLEYVDPVTGDITGDWFVSTGYNKWAEETGNKVSSKNLAKLIMEVVKSGNKQGLDLIKKTEELLERI